ncbi:MAG: helix-turn-helix domain-containing protein [Blastococcus sp.]
MQVISADVLASLAKSKGFGPVRLARYAGHENHSHVSRLMAGKARTATPRTAELIAEALGVPVSLLFVEKKVKSTDSTHKVAA